MKQHQHYYHHFQFLMQNNQTVVPQNKPSPAGSLADGEGKGFVPVEIPVDPPAPDDSNNTAFTLLLSSKTTLLIFAIIAYVIF
eukprot:UN08505